MHAAMPPEDAYIYIYIYMYVCMYVFMYVCMYVCMYIYRCDSDRAGAQAQAAGRRAQRVRGAERRPVRASRPDRHRGGVAGRGFSLDSGLPKVDGQSARRECARLRIPGRGVWGIALCPGALSPLKGASLLGSNPRFLNSCFTDWAWAYQMSCKLTASMIREAVSCEPCLKP